MSSHHFVKEGQEPALLILDTIPFSRVAPLLEWVPHVIVAEQALDGVLSWGIKIDVALQQHLSSVVIGERLADQFPLKIIDGKGDVLKRALVHLTNEKYKSVNIVIDGRPTFLHDVEEFGSQLQIAIYSGSEKYLYITNGRFEKWLPMAHRFYLMEDAKVSIGGVPTLKQGKWHETTHPGVIVVESSLPFWLVEGFVAPASGSEKNIFDA